MKRLLTFCYFCPSAAVRPGGVQQIVGPLLEGLTLSAKWRVTVAHQGECHSSSSHLAVANPSNPIQTDQVEPALLQALTLRLRKLANDADVVLSIDRLVPITCRVPHVLMANTAAYVTEASAIAAPGWSTIIVPTKYFAQRVRAINPKVDVAIVPYGLPSLVRERLAGLAQPRWNTSPLVVRLPHRPDPRKGHAAAIEGLARQSSSNPPVQLDIAWLDEPRYLAFRRELEDLASRHHVRHQVRFCPWVNGEDRWRALAASHAVLQVGNFEETFGLAAVEAVLAGRIAITANQPAIREVLASPLHIEIDDPLNWCQVFHHTFEHITRVGQYPIAQQLTQSFALDRMVAGYDTVLRQAAHCCG